MAVSDPTPRVGVGVVLWRQAGGASPPTPFPGPDCEVLVGVRKGSHAAGTLALCGGWLEWGETPTQCALREVEEETGLPVGELVNVHVAAVPPHSNIFKEDPGDPSAITTHSMTVFVAAQLRPGSAAEARTMEPHKCAGWHWVPLRAIADASKAGDDATAVVAGAEAMFPSLGALATYVTRGPA